MRYLLYKQSELIAVAMLYLIGFSGWCPSGYCVEPSTQVTSGRQIDMVKQALYDELSPGNLSLVEKAVEFQSREREPDLRLAEGKVERFKSYIDREGKIALNYAGTADADVQSRERALVHFGFMLAIARDFYCKSNYVEITTSGSSKSADTLDPYSVELVAWSAFGDSAPLEVSPKLNKCSEQTDEGQKKCGKVTYFEITRALAIREAQRQWNLFEALVRRKYPQRASGIIAAFKQASCPDVDIKSLNVDLP